MANAQVQPSFFASRTPRETRQAIQSQDRAADIELGSKSFTQLGGVMGAQAGRMLGNAAAGPDPRQVRAMKMQKAQQEVDASGIDMQSDPQGYYSAVVGSLQKQGLEGEAHQIYELAKDERSKAATAQLEQDKLKLDEEELAFRKDELAKSHPNPLVKVASDLNSVVTAMLESGSDPEEVSNLLNSLKNGVADHDVTIDSIIGGLPASRQDYIESKQLQLGAPDELKDYVTIVPPDTDISNSQNVDKVYGHINSPAVRQAIADGGVDLDDLKTNEIAKLERQYDKLVEAGVSPEKAAIAVYGRAGVSIDSKAGGLTTANRSEIQNRIVSNSALAKQLENVIPLIGEQTVGLWASLGEEWGGIGQQLPVVKSLLNVLDTPFQADNVKTAQEARAKFRGIVGPLARYVISNQGRVSNQSVEWANKAAAMLEKKTQPDVARATMKGLLQGVREAILLDRDVIRQDNVLSSFDNPENVDTAAVPGGAVVIATGVEMRDGEKVLVDDAGNVLAKVKLK